MKTFAFNLMFISFVAVMSLTVSAVELPKDLMIYLPLDEGAGDKANDFSESGYEGKLGGGAKFLKDGAPNFGGGVSLVSKEKRSCYNPPIGHLGGVEGFEALYRFRLVTSHYVRENEQISK